MNLTEELIRRINKLENEVNELKTRELNHVSKFGIGTKSPSGRLSVLGGTASSGNGLGIQLLAQTGGASSNGGDILIGAGENGSGGANGNIIFGTGSPTFQSISSEFLRISATGDLYTVDVTDYSGTSSITGWSSRTTTTIEYKKIGKLAFIQFYIAGTSNSTSTSFTVPFAAKTGYAHRAVIAAIDNGALISTAILAVGSGSGTVPFYTNMNGAGWTASGQKEILGQFFLYID